MADIEKAFLQMSVAPEDRDTCQFLWVKNPDVKNWKKEVEIYRFKRVTFGLICCPFLLAATIKEHLKREGTQLAIMMEKNLYVDNIFLFDKNL